MTASEIKKEFTNYIREWKVVKVNKVHDIRKYVDIINKILILKKKLKIDYL